MDYRNTRPWPAFSDCSSDGLARTRSAGSLFCEPSTQYVLLFLYWSSWSAPAWRYCRSFVSGNPNGTQEKARKDRRESDISGIDVALLAYNGWSLDLALPAPVDLEVKPNMVVEINKQYLPLRTDNRYRLGMWVALASIVMLFTALSSAYIVRAASANDCQSLPMPRILWLSSAL